MIAIFVLLLISVVAIALLVSSGTETALGANYRSSSAVYYAALAGLEEARGRLLQRNPNSIAAYSAPGILGSLSTTVYIVNPSSGENVAPWDSSNTYYDNEYQSEFGVAVTTTTSYPINSVWVGNTYPGPMYKWVRINAVTEQSMHTDVDNDGTTDTTPLLYYDLAHLDFNGNPWPSLITVPSSATPSPPATAGQALEITALASLPNGSKKMLQYVVAPIYPSLSFPSAVTLSGNNVTFASPNSSSFKIDGTDQAVSGVCSPSGSPPPVYAVGYTNSSDSSQTNITGAIQPAANKSNYTGYGGATPDVGLVGPGGVGPSLAANLQSVGRLNTLVQAITQSADVVVNGPATQSVMPSAMSATNPMTIVVNGDLTLNGWHATGYGVLLVTGTFTYDPDAYWDGIVLVIGKGEIYSHQGGVGTINGALFLAKTVDASGNPLPPSSPLGAPYFDYTSGAGSYGVNYSSCAVQWAQSTLTYKVLSFHEIPQ